MLVDVVLQAGGSYWRRRLDLPAPPPPGAALLLLDAPPLHGTVVGATEAEGEDGAASAAVLVRATGELPHGHETDLRSAGWRCLLPGG